MYYPLPESIGNPELLVGRKKEFQDFGKWIANIEKRISKSRVILARRKSGKTAFVQRIFNQLWSENRKVIPFYFDIGESNIWYPTLAIDYYRAFASQYISFLERDAKLVSQPLGLEQIREYGVTHAIDSFIRDVDSLFHDKELKVYDLMWKTASAAPHRFAAVYDLRFLVLLDEFQNFAQYVYPDPHCQTAPNKTLPGSFHSLSESKLAPMLVTGSYVGWLVSIIDKYLEAGRLKQIRISPYLTEEEGLQAVYKYSEICQEPVTNEMAVLINQLCMSDPFFISCVMQSTYQEQDLTTKKGVVSTVNYEISNRDSEMSMTWAEYIQLTLHKINDKYAKSILLHLSKDSDRYWTPKELKTELNIELDPNEIQRKLLILSESDVIERGSSDIRFRGLQDGTLNLILRSRFEEEIRDFVPDLKQELYEKIDILKKEKKRLRGMLNHVSGKFAEHQLAIEFRSRKRFRLSVFFKGVSDDTELNITHVQERFLFQRNDGKSLEIDILAESACGRTILVEVKKTQAKTGLKKIEDFHEKVRVYQKHFPEKTILPAFLSLGGFTEEAIQFCETQVIAIADKIQFSYLT